MRPPSDRVGRAVERGALRRALLAVMLAIGVTLDAKPPNVLIAISDDQSWPHASAYGSPMVATPAFDAVAAGGALFNNAFCASPGCSPSRAALLTGLNTWQLEHAGTHASYFHPKFETFPNRLRDAGYHVGYTGKGWGPGAATKLGRTRNPAGPAYRTRARPDGTPDFAGAFEAFLEERPAGAPFCFWFGSHDPHRSYRLGSGVESGKRLEQAEVPPFLPDVETIRSDLLDYAYEVERFDRDLSAVLDVLQESGETHNTLIIVTSDNGMPFPRAKANCYEFGVHVPMAVRWDAQIPPGQVVNGLVGFTDFTATIYSATGVEPPPRRRLAGLLSWRDFGRVTGPTKAQRETRSTSLENAIRHLGTERWAIHSGPYAPKTTSTFGTSRPRGGPPGRRRSTTRRCLVPAER